MGETPGPIPNPEAKAHCADGTALVRVWESRSPPDLTYEQAGWRTLLFSGWPAFLCLTLVCMLFRLRVRGAGRGLVVVPPFLFFKQGPS